MVTIPALYTRHRSSLYPAPGRGTAPDAAQRAPCHRGQSGECCSCRCQCRSSSLELSLRGTWLCAARAGVCSHSGKKFTGRAFDRQIGSTKGRHRYADSRIRTDASSTATIATLPVTASGHRGNLGSTGTRIVRFTPWWLMFLACGVAYLDVDS